MATSSGKGRTRNYATVLYPESAVEAWRELLSDMMVPLFVSPIHDRDTNPDGEPKKAHYHILFTFDGVKSLEQVEKLVESIGGVGCLPVNSLRGYARYLCHLDNPEKYQYNQSDVICMCGADYASAIDLPTDKYKILGEMQDFCEKYDVVSFYLLCQYARKNKIDWYRVLCDSGAVYMREYLKSRQWSRAKGLDCIRDLETGEIIISRETPKPKVNNDLVCVSDL